MEDQVYGTISNRSDESANKRIALNLALGIILSFAVTGQNAMAQEIQEIWERPYKESKTADQAIPISPFEVMRRTAKIMEILQWSRNKHLVVTGPGFLGVHHVYIDETLKHVFFCPKADLTIHVFIGNPTAAEQWRRHDSDGRVLYSADFGPGDLEWKIYKDVVLYRARVFPPKDIPEEPYWGKVTGVESIDYQLSDQVDTFLGPSNG